MPRNSTQLWKLQAHLVGENVHLAFTDILTFSSTGEINMNVMIAKLSNFTVFTKWSIDILDVVEFLRLNFLIAAIQRT